MHKHTHAVCAHTLLKFISYVIRGWFHHSVDTLLPVITQRDYLLHLVRHTDPSEYESIRSLKHHLKLAQDVVTDSIYLAKATWSALQAKRIHNMRFTPKDVWKGVKILVGRENKPSPQSSCDVLALTEWYACVFRCGKLINHEPAFCKRLLEPSTSKLGCRIGHRQMRHCSRN